MPAINTPEQLAAIIDAAPTALIAVDQEGSIVLVNAQAERLFAYSRDELLGETIDILLPFRFRAAHPGLRASFMNEPMARPMGEGRDLFGLRKDGLEFPIEIGLNPISTQAGTIVVSAIVDITERKRLEARFRATIEAAPIAMVMIDESGRILLVNAELERVFGYAREELLDREIEVLIPARLRSSHPHLRDQFFGSPEARRMGVGRTLFGLRKDGSDFPVEIGLNPVDTDEGQFVLAAIMDVTEQRERAEAALRQANEALMRSNLELNRFASVASHDLQTPLRNVASFVQLLQSTYQDQLDARANDWIRRIVESVKQLQALIRDLLEYSRIDSQIHPFERVPLDEVFEHVISLLGAPELESGAEITSGKLPTVMGDRSQLVQLLLNLIDNGLKYSGAEATRIHVSCERRSDEEWLFAVHDNGIGIAEGHQEQIFEIFTRLQDQRQYPGSGIGLAICRRVVDRHGGRIWVESDLGQGSVFYFTIPQSREIHDEEHSA
jgi:PAS domain S-box-containing protein